MTLNEELGLPRPDYSTVQHPVLSFSPRVDTEGGEDYAEVLLDGSAEMGDILRAVCDRHFSSADYREARLDFPGGRHFTFLIRA